MLVCRTWGYDEASRTATCSTRTFGGEDSLQLLSYEMSWVFRQTPKEPESTNQTTISCLTVHPQFSEDSEESD